VEERRSRVDRILDWIWFTALPAYGRRVMGLPLPLRIAVAILSVLVLLALFVTLIGLAALGRMHSGSR